MVEAELGFTFEQVHEVYRQGAGRWMTEEQRHLRARLDARLLQLAKAGGNMVALGRILGFRVDESKRSCAAITNALARAREKEAA
jgi:hypothetical protein